MTNESLSAADFDKIRKFVYELTRIDLSESKKPMLASRLNRRLRATDCESYAAYYRLLQSLPREAEEISEFINAVTTNTTHFYREPHHFVHAVKVAIPALREAFRGHKPQLRIWHAGCSTGEEVYTMSMVLHESLPKQEQWSVSQFASDIDTRALQAAARGIYDPEKLQPVPAGLHGKYFLRSKNAEQPRFKVKPILQEWVKFEQMNLLDQQWPFRKDTQFDLIFCRNVMIYFDKPTQKQLVEQFSQHLAPGGFLYIGHAESLHGINAGLRLIGQTTYQKQSLSLERAA